jgi:hypothetical protein
VSAHSSRRAGGLERDKTGGAGASSGLGRQTGAEPGSSDRLHALGGRLTGVHSVSINLSYRITLHMLISEQEIVLLNVGDHDAAN